MCNGSISSQVDSVHSAISLTTDLPPVGWNSPSYLNKLQQCIMSLQLPPPPTLPPDWAEAEWPHQSAQCLDYIASIEVSGSTHGSVTLLSRYGVL